jgi:uncharacterized protein YjdB/N-acetylmuramoyl-L-alanine amidase
MKRFKKTVAFALVLGSLIGAQAMGFDFKNLQAAEVSKNHPTVSLQSIETEKLNPDYVSVGSRVLQANGSQIVKVGLGADLTDVGSVSLKYRLSGSEKVMVQDTKDIKNGYITFEYALEKDTEPGQYNLQDIELKSEDGTLLSSVDLEQLGAYYTVVSEENQASAESAAVAAAEVAAPAETAESAASAVVTVDEDNAITGADIGAAIESSKKAMKDETGISSVDNAAAGNEVSAAAGNVTIVLDPGHGGTESGAVYNGLYEKTLNLKIAEYAKAELETYEGVTVGMTRTADSNVGLEERAIKAGAQGGNILVSLHNNASGYGTMYGAEVFVSVLNAYHDSSAVLGKLIVDQLAELGIYNRGVKSRASETGTIFTLTGELADYYAVIKYSAYRGFPGIIVEHAFMDNANDAQKYLSSDAKLKELGVADATALAQYYGLKKKSASDGSITYGKLPTTSATFTNLSTVTDGNRSTDSHADDYPAGSGLQYVQMDLGADYDVSNIKLWHYYADGRKYKDVIVQASNDPAFANGVTTLYSNDKDNSAGRGTGASSEYIETSAGLDIPVTKVTGRYVRFYSNGSNMNSNNHYVEAAVYGTKRIHPASVSLSKATDALTVGGTDTLTASVLPADATDKSVTWSSSSPGVAAVSQSGLVTGVSAGTASITATTADGSLKASCAVTVKIATSNLASGKLFASKAFTNLSAITDGNKSTGSYSDDYPDYSGLQYVQADLGEYYDLNQIKLWHYYGDGRKYKDVIVQISNDPAFATDVTTVFNNDTNNSAGKGLGTNSEYAETSSGLDIEFDTVNARYVRFYSNGSSVNSNNHYVEVEIYGAKGAAVHPATVSLSKTTITLEAGETDTLTTSVLPLNTSDKSVTWSSSAPGVATVSQGGLVTAVSAGTAKITATTKDGNLTSSCTVTVPAAQASNLAAGKLPLSSAFTNLSVTTDGSKNTNSYADDYPKYSGLQYMQMDLGASYTLSDIKLWHYFGDGRKYKDVIVQVSNDSAFAAGVTTVFNNDSNNSAGRGTGTDSEYAETSAGLDIGLGGVSARYVRFYSNGSNMNSNNHYAEIEVYGNPASASSNLAAGKALTSSVSFANLSKVTDGNRSTANYVDCYPAAGLQWVQVDLGAAKSISSVSLWHYYGDTRKYHDVIVQVSNDPAFATGVTTLYNNDADNSAGRGTGTGSEYAETSAGLNIQFPAVSGRYVRFYSSGSTANAYNHYVEAEVYGK